MSSETAYVETEIVLAVLNEDTNRALQLIKDMLPRERLGLEITLTNVCDLMNKYKWCQHCNTYIDGTNEAYVPAFSRPSETGWLAWHWTCWREQLA